MQKYQNAFQNASELRSFNYNNIANQSSTFLIMILAIILLIALLRSEARYRALLEHITSSLKDKGLD